MSAERLPLALALTLLAGCPRPESGEARAASVALERCHVSGLDAEARCGVVPVWEDRRGQAGRRIPLRVVVLPAVSPRPAPDPVFFLAGGPGQAATEVAAMVAPLFTRIQRDRDVVFVDQRGTGASNGLPCELSAEDALTDGDAGEQVAARLSACRAGYDADLRLYTTPIAMDDLDEVRAALGYDRINLYGGSYGTRAGLVYLRQHGDRVRTAVLDGVAPPEMELFLHFGTDGQAVLDQTIAACEADAGCRTAFPGFRKDFSEMLGGFASPREVELRHPRTGASSRAVVSRDDLAGSVRGMLYSPVLTALLPLATAAAKEGDLSPLFAVQPGSTSLGDWLLTGGASQEPGALYTGMMFSVVCSEDVPRITAEKRAAAEHNFLGDGLTARVVRWCEGWPRGELPADYTAPVVSDVPTLVLSGGLDPVTPPRWGESVVKHLSRGVHGVAPNAGHNVVAVPCALGLMEELYQSGTTYGLDVSCLTKAPRPPFFVDPQGPAL